MNKKILFIITSLGVGGAQMMLYKLLTRLDRTLFSPEILTLVSPGDLTQKFKEIDVPITSLSMRIAFPDPLSLLRLIRMIRSIKPDLIQTWMYHADLIGGLAAQFAACPPVIWNIRHSNLDWKVDKTTTILTAKACALASGYLPTKIVCCAHLAQQIHGNLGYKKEKMLVIPNGFDLAKFMPNTAARDDVRRELGIPTDAMVIGYVSRFHPQKDHQTFIRAAALLSKRVPGVHFLLCGDDVNRENIALSSAINESGISEWVHLLGQRTDISRLTAALDIASSTSICGEAFSNTVGEAMACAIPCVVTDVGDSAMIVGKAGIVVPPGDHNAICNAWHELITMGIQGRMTIGQAARQRVQENYSLTKVTKQYQELYSDILHL